MIAAIINSRTGKAPFGKWLENTFNAVAYCAKREHRICASVELHQWEFLLYCASALDTAVKIYVPDNFSAEMTRKLMHEFNLDSDNCSFVNIQCKRKSKSNATSGKNWWRPRDEKILADADIIYPIAIRPGGFFKKALEKLESSEMQIDTRYSVEHKSPTWRAPTVPKSENINPELITKPWHFLTHWTHTSYEPWRDESKYQFYRSIHENKDDYSHSAYQGLRNILNENRIVTTQRKIRGQFEVVSFTEHAPLEALFFMSWRKGLIRNYWEPYGIAIDREWLLKHGARPVLYGNDDLFDSLDESCRPFFQPIRSSRYTWTEEREWRIVNDLNLNIIPDDKKFVITRTSVEAKQIEEEFGIRAIPMVE